MRPVSTVMVHEQLELCWYACGCVGVRKVPDGAVNCPPHSITHRTRREQVTSYKYINKNYCKHSLNLATYPPRGIEPENLSL